MEIRASYEPMNQRIGLYILEGDRHAEPLVLIKHGPHEHIGPTVSIDNKGQLQTLFDDLWCLGLRPSARSDEYKAQLESVKDHLNDMRCLVFKNRFDGNVQKI